MTLDRLFDKALKLGGDTYSREDVVEKIRTGEFQCFHNDEAVVISSVHDDPKARYLHVFVVAGRWERVLELQDKLEQFAMEAGCKFMVTTGRKGLTKRLPQIGWKPAYVTFRKELPHV